MPVPSSEHVVYHLELKSFPHTSRVFNLDRETVDLKFVKPWVEGEMLEYDDKRWAADRTKLKILEGSLVDRGELGLGRGWGEATRHSQDVTERVIAEIQRGASARPEVEALKRAIAEVAGEPIGPPDVIALAAAGHPTWRASEQLSLAEQAIWEMLHRSQLEMLDGGDPVATDRWQEILLSWVSWTGEADRPVRLRLLGEAG